MLNWIFMQKENIPEEIQIDSDGFSYVDLPAQDN